MLVAVALSRLEDSAPRRAHASSAGSKEDEGKYWSSFRGLNQGVSAWDNAPVIWDGKTGKNVLWKVPLPSSGIGSPVVWNNRLYLTEGNEKERSLLAFDADSGKELWRRIVPDGGK